MTNNTQLVSVLPVSRLRDDCHAAVCGLQELRHHLIDLRNKRWPAKDWDASNEYVSANVGHASKVAEWDLPKVEAAIKALSGYWELLYSAAPAEDVRAVGEEPVAWLNAATGNVTTSTIVVMDWDDEREEVHSLYRHPQRYTMQSVMAAICAIPRFPMLTSNQCHALAKELNK